MEIDDLTLDALTLSELIFIRDGLQLLLKKARRKKLEGTIKESINLTKTLDAKIGEEIEKFVEKINAQKNFKKEDNDQ